MGQLIGSLVNDETNVICRLTFNEALSVQNRISLEHLFKATWLEEESESESKSFTFVDNSHFVSWEDLKFIVKKFPSFKHIEFFAEQDDEFILTTSYVPLFELKLTKEAVLNHYW